jgi:hypothetical protein
VVLKETQAGQIPQPDIHHNFDVQANRDDSEEADLIRVIPVESWDEALKKVFDYSRKLAISASKHFKMTLETDDFRRMLEKSTIPCTQGQWSKNSSSVYVTTSRCHAAQTKEKRFCDWYKEAIDGLVMGLGDTERYVRHGAQAYGDLECVDVIYDDRPGLDADLTYAPIPPPLLGSLDDIVAKVFKTGMQLSFVGYRAGTLFYTLTNFNPDKPLCQSSGRRAHTLVQSSVSEIFPTLGVQDASPLAVYGEGTK